MWDLNAMNSDIFQWYSHKAETPLNFFSRGPVCFTWAIPLSCFRPFSINSAYSTKESPHLSDLLLDVERHLVRWWRWDRANEKCERSYEQMLKWFVCSSGRWRTLICHCLQCDAFIRPLSCWMNDIPDKLTHTQFHFPMGRLFVANVHFTFCLWSQRFFSSELLHDRKSLLCTVVYHLNYIKWKIQHLWALWGWQWYNWLRNIYKFCIEIDHLHWSQQNSGMNSPCIFSTFF